MASGSSDLAKNYYGPTGEAGDSIIKVRDADRWPREYEALEALAAKYEAPESGPRNKSRTGWAVRGIHVCCEIYLLVSGLADDYLAARAALVAAAESEIPTAVVVDVAEPPEIGFEFVVQLPATMDESEIVELCSRVQLRLAGELDRRAVMQQSLSVTQI